MAFYDLGAWVNRGVSPAFLLLSLGLFFLALRLRSRTLKTDPTATPQSQLRPFKPIYHITMALRSVAPADLITIDEHYASRVALRRRLVEQHGRGVHGIADGGAGPTRELYTHIVNHVVARYPGIFTLNGKTVTNRITGLTFPLVPGGDEAALLRALAETVEEDLFLLLQEGDTHRCVAFCCCFPSGFDPASKLDQGLAGIHAPVPSYERIGPSMERFFSRMEVGKPVRRVNWGVQTHGELFDSDRKYMRDESASGIVDIETTHLRCELQTLTRLPETNALLFSFKTYLYPVKQLKDEGLGPEFAHAIEGLGKGNAPGMWDYKAAVRWGPPVVEYLRS